MAGTLVIDTLKASSGVLATQNGMTGIAKAWANFNGTAATIRSSFNVSSITRSGVGQYLVNFTTAMPNANYSATVSGHKESVYEETLYTPSTSFTTTYVGVYNYAVSGGGFKDTSLVSVVVIST